MLKRVTMLPAFTVTLVVTSVVSTLAFSYPALMELLRRDPARLAGGEWWRIVSPLLVQSDGWYQFITNMILLAFFGTAVEQKWGSRTFVILYLVGGLAGELAGYAWEPHGAGSSVGVCGLIGGLLLGLLRSRLVLPSALHIVALCFIASLLVLPGGNVILSLAVFAVIGFLQVWLSKKQLTDIQGKSTGIIGFVGIVLLIAAHDIHGVALLGGFLTAASLYRQLVPAARQRG